MSFIFNAASVPLNLFPSGDVPDVSGALQSYMQPMVFEKIGKIVNGYQVIEIGDPINFQATIQPFNKRQLLLLPEGQRAWTWWEMVAQIGIPLQVDDVVLYLGKQTRVMARINNSLYGYWDFFLVQDWTGAGPI